MKKLLGLEVLLLAALLLVGCTSGPRPQDYQNYLNEKVASPFFYVPPLNQKDYESRTWVLLAESQSKLWFYDPYTLSEDDDGILTFDAFFKPREQNSLEPFNPTLVGPYRQKLDCFSSNQWSETFYVDQLPAAILGVGGVKPINGSGWVKVAPRTAMAYVRTRLCGRKFLDEQNINYFLYQDGYLPMPIAKQAAEKPSPQKVPVVYEVINNEVVVLDAQKDVRQIKLGAYLLEGYFPKKADYLFTANCQSNTYSITAQGKGDNSSGVIGAKDSIAAVAFNRACGDHGSYMKQVAKFSK